MHSSDGGPRAGRGAGLLLILVVLVAGGAIAWPYLRPAPDVTLPIDRSTLDQEVIDVIERQLALVNENPRSADAHARLALVYEANDLWQEAAMSYDTAITLDDSQPIWAYHKAIALSEMGRNDEVVATLNGVVDDLPDVAAPHYFLGDKLLENGELEGAEAAFERARAIARDRFEPLVGLGQVRNQQERFSEAIPLLEQATKLSPQNKSARYALGLAYRGMGRMDDAQRELALGQGAKKGLMGDPLSADKAQLASTYVGQFTKAVNLIDGGRPREGAAVLERLLLQRPDDTNIYNNLAAAYIETEQYARASALLEKYVTIEPEAFAAYINLAACSLGMQKANEALQYADKAVSLAPQVGKTHYLRARSLTAIGMLPEAYEALQKSVSLDANEAMAFVAMGEVAHLLGNSELAIGHYREATRMVPNYLPAWVSLASLLARLGRCQEAEAAVIEAEKLAPEHSRVIGARRNLEARCR